MPRRSDISHVLVIGSGPIVIGQACEFDYSGTQACRVLRDEGIRVSLINSNPATIMTDPDFADATYVEPINAEFVEKVLGDQQARGFPVDAVLATLGGQTALNTAIALDERGVLNKFGVELIGADVPAINRGEDRQIFKDVVRSVGGDVPRSTVCHTMDEVRAAVADLGLPVVVRPSFTMGGLGSGMAYTLDDLERIAGRGLAASQASFGPADSDGPAKAVGSAVSRPGANAHASVLIEESVLGWKEFELELMRDGADNAVVVCSIENLDPMGVHTGDSITVAPAMTLTDREYQRMRDLGLAILRAVGVATGGCNIQFAVNPANGRIIVIEMNPRVSRSSALASKATGFPIAKIAAKLAIGYTLDEIANDITRATPAAFEPALDYVVVKIPRFAFEKFPGADPTLTTTMKSVGEAMSIGRSFAEALGKAMRSMETKLSGFWTGPEVADSDLAALLDQLRIPLDGRIYGVERALGRGATVEQVHEATGIDPWFLDQIELIRGIGNRVRDADQLGVDLLRIAKRHGLSDLQIAALRPEFGSEKAV
ncbi:MAG TPA: carbamoyl phosphate synthase large subunit, partial [Nakamurella sp.]